MKIQQLIFCGAAVLLLGNRVSADDLTGQWAGLAPDGLVFPSGSGKCNADVLLDLTNSGGVLSGSFRAIVQITTDGCLTQNYLSREVTTNQILPARVTGTVGVGTLSLNILMADFRNGVPLSLSAVVASGTFTADRLTTTGILMPRRTWNDANHNNVPDCDLLKPTANGECGAWSIAPPATPMTLVATFGPELIEGTTFVDSVTLSTGQNLICLDGSITGDVKADGGSLVLHNCAVDGNVQMSGSGTFLLGSTSIQGNVVVKNIPAGSAVNKVCDTTVRKALTFQGNGTTVQIGSTVAACPGNTIGGSVDVSGNTAITAIFNNVVGGDMQVDDNTAATQIFNNTITGKLECSGNVAQPMNSITGGGNTAKQKQGQCAAF